jgi:2-polyprenyl-6-methoxyphenol hydroxylase-like FAD-dependent oxidoreductase
VVILGGGPAGCAAARLLAVLGHGVHLIAKPPNRSGLAVSIPPSTGRLIDRLGFADAFAAVPSVR